MIRLDADLTQTHLTATGGGNATIVVTIPLTTLQSTDPGTATILGTRHQLSTGATRRLACDNAIIPTILGGNSQVLDLGRTRRLHSKAQRLALAVQQAGTCGIDHCDRPTTWCEAHHHQPWSTGGPTTLDNGVLLCPRHHTLAHQQHLRLDRQPHGTWQLTQQ